MSNWRGFRFQTGEIDDLIKALTADKHASADIDNPDELEIFHTALAQKGVIKDQSAEPDYKAVDLNENPDFYARYIYNAPFGRVSVDYYLVDQYEETYANVFLD